MIPSLKSSVLIDVYMSEDGTLKNSIKTVQPTVEHGGASVIVLICFVGHQIGDHVQIKDIIRKKEYLDILQDLAIPSGSHI